MSASFLATLSRQEFELFNNHLRFALQWVVPVIENGQTDVDILVPRRRNPGGEYVLRHVGCLREGRVFSQRPKCRRTRLPFQ